MNNIMEMATLYIVPPNYCRNTPQNVVSLSSKAQGIPSGAVKETKPLPCQGTSAGGL